MLIDWLAAWTVLLLKRRRGLFLTSVALLVVSLASLLYVNTPNAGLAGPTAVLAWASLGAFYAVVGFGAFRLAHPDSRWARRFYGPDKLFEARRRWSTGPGADGGDPAEPYPHA